MESIRLTKEDFDEIYPFFSEMRKVDYEKYLTVTLKQIEKDFINAQNDPTLKAIMNFVDKVSDYLYINDILPARDVTLDQYVRMVVDFKEFMSKPEKKFDHLGRKHDQDQEEMVDKVRKQHQEMRQERRKKILGENRKQEADAKTKAEIEDDVKLKEKKKKYIPYLRNEIRNGKEVNIEEEVKVIENNKDLTRRMKDESIEFVKKMVVALQPYENKYRSLERLYKEQNIQFAQILRAGTQQLLDYRSEILKLESENEQLRIKLATKDREESDRIKQATKDLTNAKDTIRILLEKELKTKPEIKPASKNQQTVNEISKFLNQSFGEIKNLDTQFSNDVYTLEEVLRDVIKLMREKGTAVNQQALDAFNAFKSDDDPSFIKEKLKDLIQSLIACNVFRKSKLEEAEEESLKNVKDRIQRTISTEKSPKDVEFKYSQDLVKEVSDTVIEDVTTLTEFFLNIEQNLIKIKDDFYRGQYIKIIERVLSHSAFKFDNDEQKLNNLKEIHNTQVRKLLDALVKNEPDTIDLEKMDSRQRYKEETFDTKLKTLINNKINRVKYIDEVDEKWYEIIKQYLKIIEETSDVISFYKVLLKNKIPRVFERHLYDVLNSEDELDRVMASVNLKEFLAQVIEEYKITQRVEAVTKGGDDKEEEELKQPEPTKTLEKNKDEPIEEKHSELAEKLLEHAKKGSSISEFIKENKGKLSQHFIEGDEKIIKQIEFSPLLNIFRIVDNLKIPMYKSQFEFIQPIITKDGVSFEYYKYDSRDNMIIYDAI